jgi:ABC-type polysaccharide/polyol phosphate export permease
LGRALSAPGVPTTALRTALREPARSLVHTIARQIKETVRYRALVRYLVSSSLRTESAGTVFGYLWWLLDPLLLMAAYVVLVDVILQSARSRFCGRMYGSGSSTFVTTSTRGSMRREAR